MKRFIGILIAFFLIGSNASAGQSAKICMFPLAFTTLVATDMQSIEEICEKIIVDEKNEIFLKMINSIYKQEAGHFDNRVVRVKIEFFDGRKVFIDREGGVKFGKIEFKMNKSDFENFKYFLYRMY